MKLKLAGIIQFACVLGLAVGIYALKGQADTKGDALAKLEQQIAEDRAEIRKLEAEIAYFAQPGRIEVAAKDLGLRPASASQIAQVADIEQIAALQSPSAASPATSQKPDMPHVPNPPVVMGAR